MLKCFDRPSDWEGSECVTKAANDLGRLRIRLAEARSIRKCQGLRFSTEGSLAMSLILSTEFADLLIIEFAFRVFQVTHLDLLQQLVSLCLGFAGHSGSLRDNNALESAYQNARYIDYKEIPYKMMLAIALLKYQTEPNRGNRLY